MRTRHGKRGQSFTAKPRDLFSPGPRTVTRDGYYAAQKGAVVITAKYPGQCRICREGISIGESIAWKRGFSAHVGCISPT